MPSPASQASRDRVPALPTDWRAWLTLLVFLAACFAAAGIGGWVTAGSVETWYPTLDKPVWTPPSWVFGPVWTTLYAVIGVAGWRAWEASGGVQRGQVTALFAAQLVLNVAWSGLFFGLQSPGLALVEILVLLAAIAWTAVAFHDVDRPAGWLMLPYLAWVTFAATVNAGVWWLN